MPGKMSSALWGDDSMQETRRADIQALTPQLPATLPSLGRSPG